MRKPARGVRERACWKITAGYKPMSERTRTERSFKSDRFGADAIAALLWPPVHSLVRARTLDASCVDTARNRPVRDPTFRSYANVNHHPNRSGPKLDRDTLPAGECRWRAPVALRKR